MKRFLLTTVCVSALASQAKADVPVIDPTSILMEAKSLAQEAKTYLVEAQSYAMQGEQKLIEDQQLAGFIHDPSLGSATGLMNSTGLSNSLPVNPYALQSLTNGYGSLTGLLGKLSSLSSLVNTNYSANHVYSPTDGSWNSQQLVASGNSIAGAQGAAQAVYQDLRNHMPILQALRDRLSTATNPKDVADAQAAISSEAAWTSNLQNQLQAVQTNYQAQSDSRMQRDNESLTAGIDSFLSQAKAAGRGL